MKLSFKHHAIVAAVVLGMGSQANGPTTDQSISGTYRFTIAGHPVRSGTLWLFY